MTEQRKRNILGTKLGMTQVWDENNQVVPVTVIQAGPCVVAQVRTEETDGYSAIQLGFGQVDPRRVNKPDAGHFAKAGIAPQRHLVELRTGTPAPTRWARRSRPTCSRAARWSTSPARPRARATRVS